MTTTRRPTEQRGQILRLPEPRDIVDRVDHVFEFAFSRKAELVGRAEAHAEKDSVVFAAQVLEFDVLAKRDPVPNLDAADRQDEGGFLRGEAVDRLVGGDAVFVEAAGFRPRLEDGRLDAGDRELMRAGEARRPGADNGDPLAGRRAARIGRFACGDHRVRRVALQEADRDRLAFSGLAHAGLFAQRLGRTDARAHPAHDVGVENCPGRSIPIVRRDLTDEERNVDRGRTGLLAGRVETEVATLCLDPGFVAGERRVQIGKVRFDCGLGEPAGRDV